MKKETEKQNMTEGQIRWSIKDVSTDKLNFIEKRRPNGPVVPNHPTFGGAGGKLCNGPPGRARSPGVHSLDREIPIPSTSRMIGTGRDGTERAPVLIIGRHLTICRKMEITFGNQRNIEYQMTYEKQIFTYYKHLIFKNMKKQILILAFFVLALLAGSLTSYGQLTTSNLLPTATTCVTDPLHPVAGKTYTYAIDNTNSVAPTSYSWWITKNTNFVTAASLPDETGKIVAGAGGVISTTANGATDGKSIDIVWSPELLALTKYPGTGTEPTFVAVMTNGACSNNLQVYQINPSASFTLDITNINAAGVTQAYGQDVPQCVAPIHSAKFTGTAVTMDYGKDSLYYEVIAANFVTSWKPTFTIMTGSLAPTQTADIYYAETLAKAKSGAYIDQSLGLADGAVFSSNKSLTSAIANTSVGVSVYVKVVIHNNNEQSIADRKFTLAVDGQDSTNAWDLVNSTCTPTAAADMSDFAFQTITARPDVIDKITPTPASAPTTFLPKN